MKWSLVLFDEATFKISPDTKKAISVPCANTTLFAWTVTNCGCTLTRNIVSMSIPANMVLKMSLSGGTGEGVV